MLSKDFPRKYFVRTFCSNHFPPNCFFKSKCFPKCFLVFSFSLFSFRFRVSILQVFVWHVVLRNRVAMSEWLRMTSGRNLKLARLQKQFHKWSNDKGLKWSSLDCEAAMVRARTMVAHITQFKKDSLTSEKMRP